MTDETNPRVKEQIENPGVGGSWLVDEMKKGELGEEQGGGDPELEEERDYVEERSGSEQSEEDGSVECSDKIVEIVNREGSNFVLFLNRTAVLMGQSESVAQPTPGTSSGTDSATIPPVLTEQDIPGAALNVVN